MDDAIDKLYGDYEYSTASSQLKEMVSNICNCFKTKMYINCIHKSAKANWVTLWFNAAGQMLGRKLFHKIGWKKFDFLDANGICLYKIYF